MKTYYLFLFALLLPLVGFATGPTSFATAPTTATENATSLLIDACDDATEGTYLTGWSSASLMNSFFCQEESVMAQMDLPVTFDDEGIDYDVVDFGGNASMIVADPTDATNMVVQSTKGVAAATWAGTTLTSSDEVNGPLGFASRIPFAEGATTMSVRIWSPTAGTPMMVKVEKKDDPTISVETLATTTVAGAWETLVFDFGTERTGTAAINFASVYDKASVFFNFGTEPTEAVTYYWDDVFFGGEPVNNGSQMDLPVTFEEEGVDYGVSDFGGNESMIVADPEDAANTVVQSTKTAGAMTWGGTTLTSSAVGGPVGFASEIPFSASATTMSVRVWSPTAGTPVLLKAENNDNGAVSVETLTNTTVASGWETLVFDFSMEATGTPALDLGAVYGKVSIFFNFGTSPTADATYYWDDISFIGGTGGNDSQMDLPVTFEDEAVDYGVADFGGNESMIVADPEDATNTVVQSTKTAGAMTWGGTTLTSTADGGLDGFASQIPFTAAATTMSVKVWSPTAGTPVLLKVEKTDDPAISVETLTNTTVAGAWETLVFDFSVQAMGTAALDLGAVYGKASIFFNFGTSPTEAATYYWDDVFFVGEPGSNDAQMDLPVTFDEEGIAYDVVDFGGNTSMIVADPEDAANTVVQSTKGVAAATWAGTTLTSSDVDNGPLGFASRIPFSASETTMSVRVWSPTAGTPVMLKVEKKDDPTISVETLANTTVAGAWETLVFDFGTERTGTAAINFASVYDKASIFFNFGTEPTEAVTYYWDDVIFGGEPGGGGDATQMDLPVTFEDEGIDYGVADFGNNVSMIVADPTDATNTVVQSTKTAGAETWAGTTLTSSSGGPVGFASQIPFTATATKMVLRVWSPTAGTPVLLKVENKDDPAVSVETLTNTTVAGAWETLVFDFSMEATGTAALNLGAVYDKASIFFNFGTSPMADATYYWDDVYFGDVVSTNEPLTGLLEAFPNPVGDEFSIVAPELMESLILFSTSGRKMGEWQPMAERFTLEASHLAPGMYVALVRTQRGLMTIKVMKK